MKVSKLTSSQWLQRASVACVLLTIAAGAAHAQATEDMRSRNQPVEPFRIIGNVYYVGASDITSYLIVTPAGDIVLDGGLLETAPQIEANIRALGFRLSDVKILLSSHAHFDHAGGLAEMKKNTGAKLVSMNGDADELARGGRGDFFFGDTSSFPPVAPDRVIPDGDTVGLGGTKLTAHLTPGHTQGCTTWTMTATEAGREYNVVFVCSATVLDGYVLVDRPRHPASYPGIAADYEKSFRVWKSLPCDVFLASHGQFFNLTEKRAVLKSGTKDNPFIDPVGYAEHVSQNEANFRAELNRQKAEAARTDKTPGTN
jgi:metallo-beta-lactamase class B